MTARSSSRLRRGTGRLALRRRHHRARRRARRDVHRLTRAGQYSLSPDRGDRRAAASRRHRTAWAPEAPTAAGVILDIRLPRIVLGLLVGAALAVSGVLMQAIFGNPLADAAVVGVSSGAALGAAASITFGLAFFGMWTTPGVRVRRRARRRVRRVPHQPVGRTHRGRHAAAHRHRDQRDRRRGSGLPHLPRQRPRRASRSCSGSSGSLNGALWPNVALVAPLVAIGVVDRHLACRGDSTSSRSASAPRVTSACGSSCCASW